MDATSTLWVHLVQHSQRCPIMKHGTESRVLCYPRFRSYAFWQLSDGLFPSWMFIPFTAYFLFPSHPSPFASTPNHSLLVAVYWYPFFTFRSPTIFLLIPFSHFVIPSFSFNKWNFLCSANCFSLWSQRICFLTVLCAKKLQKFCKRYEFNGFQHNIHWPLNGRPWLLGCASDLLDLLYTKTYIWHHTWR
jgi:hypothetical protein